MDRNLLLMGTTCALAGVVLGSFFQGVSHPRDITADGPAKVTVANPTDLSSFTLEEQVNISAYEKVHRSVVHITTRATRTDFCLDGTPIHGSGSGSVLDKSGHILTNYHVIEDAHQVRVTLANNNSYPAHLVGQDPSNDLAVLRIDAPQESLHPVHFGDSAGVRVGQKVFAIGNPFGLERTLTVGIISSLNRTLPTRNRRTMKSIIQIDAALNQGNSGGPLLDSKSQFIGMNTAIASRSGENTGVGFAIPVNTIKRVIPQLIEKGRVTHPDLDIARVYYQTQEGRLIATLGIRSLGGRRWVKLCQQLNCRSTQEPSPMIRGDHPNSQSLVINPLTVKLCAKWQRNSTQLTQPDRLFASTDVRVGGAPTDG